MIPSNRRRRRRRAPNSLLRVILAALAVAVIVAVSAFFSTLMRKPNLDVLAFAPEATPTEEPTPSPRPTATPTTPVYAPFGAQYGYGGEELIPETPMPDPAAVTPSPTATPTPTPSTLRTLKKGSSGEDVKLLQQALIGLGYLNDTADGAFGTNTQNAVIMFQAVNGLSADGIAGEKTLTLLYSGDALSADEAPEMDYLILVNRTRPLEKNYVPTDLVPIADIIPEDLLKVKYAGTMANRTATEALGRMLADAVAQGVTNWQVSSAYRSYAEQQTLVDNSAATYKRNNPSWSTSQCLSATYQTVAPAGTSEHQTGLAFDITVPGVSFSGTEQQKWLHAHCVEYGFVVRFTADKEKITGFLAESWHIRYVGTEAAAVMDANNWCLEEYVENMGL